MPKVNPSRSSKEEEQQYTLLHRPLASENTISSLETHQADGNKQMSPGSAMSVSTVLHNDKLGKIEKTSIPTKPQLPVQSTSFNTLATNTPSNNDQLLFFNYHEYSVSSYQLLKTNHYGPQEHPLAFTHFPNPYVNASSEEYRTTRIVRVPRIYNAVPNNRYPQFSSFLPGFEPAALVDPNLNLNNKEFQLSEQKAKNISLFNPTGNVYNQIYGFSSVSPLLNYLNHQDFTEIVTEINSYLKLAFNIGPKNLAENFVNFLTLWMFDECFTNHSKKALLDLEKYINNLNETKLEPLNIKVISPLVSGYISVSYAHAILIIFTNF